VAFTFVRKAKAVFFEDVADGLIGDDDPKIGQCPSGDTIVTPRWVLLGEWDDQLFDLGPDGWTSRLGSATVGESQSGFLRKPSP
jgi:hypothetical protein